MEDAELIKQILAGRHELFTTLVERHQVPLLHFLRRLVSTDEEAFDCAQEAFLAVYRNLWRYSEAYTFRAWLYTIARNKALDLYRKRWREVPLTAGEHLVEQQPGPEEQWLVKEEANRLRQVLDGLPEHYRQALYLRYKQELSYEEISVVLGIPLSRVKTYLHRGKDKLRQELERRGLDEGYGQYAGSPVS